MTLRSKTLLIGYFWSHPFSKRIFLHFLALGLFGAWHRQLFFSVKTLFFSWRLIACSLTRNFLFQAQRTFQSHRMYHVLSIFQSVKFGIKFYDVKRISRLLHKPFRNFLQRNFIVVPFMSRYIVAERCHLVYYACSKVMCDFLRIGIRKKALVDFPSLFRIRHEKVSSESYCYRNYVKIMRQ